MSRPGLAGEEPGAEVEEQPGAEEAAPERKRQFEAVSTDR